MIAALVGPEGLTEKASSFGRRDVIDHAAELLPRYHPAPARTAGEARELLEAIADRVLRDPRVIPLLDPAARTSGEVIRPRDTDGRVLREVCTQTERRYSTVDLLAAEHELLQRANARQTDRIAVVPEEQVDAALAAFPGLDADQQAMVRRLASSGAGVDVVVGKAGTGKTTAMRAYGDLARRAGLQVLAVAPSATAAHQLSVSAGIEACTLDKLLVEVAHGHRHLPPDVVVIVDEAAMVDTRNRLALQRLVDDAGGKVVDVGDHRQIPSVDVGGIHHVLATKLGAVTLGVNHRFRNPGYRDAADLIRDGHADKGIQQLRALGAVHEYDEPADAWAAMVGAWARLRAGGADVRMFATERAVVGRLNLLARDHLTQTGEVASRGRDYVSDDDARAICLAVGDRVRLGRNDSRLPQPDGTTVTVRNGMTGTITRTTRRHVTVKLDADHRNPDGPAQIVLPAGYAGADVDYSYATTTDKAQAADVDDSLFAPSPATSAERAYVALSRGRHSNRIYAVADSGWDQAIATSRAHTLASDQQPDWARPEGEELQPEAG
ncbi:MAG: AAA family ATPase, partial [Micromonosporaceae bacterium]|nr:AAA family ATPase [Micromonosporaceae bacterium]